MIKTEKVSANKIEDIISKNNPSFSGILTGECAGDLWVDDIDKPTMALVYSFAVGGFSIMGKPQKDSVFNQFYDFLIDELFIQLKEKKINYFEFSVENLETKKRFLEMFSNKKIESEYELFHRNYYQIEKKRSIPIGYKIAQVDLDFVEKLENGKFKNKEMLELRLLKSWGSFQNFLSKSVAFVALDTNEIVSVIIGTARFQNIIPIDIETEQQHRKKGLASTLAYNFVNECIKQKLVPQWNCVDSNHVSKKIAENSGFILMKKEPFYWFSI